MAMLFFRYKVERCSFRAADVEEVSEGLGIVRSALVAMVVGEEISRYVR